MLEKLPHAVGAALADLRAGMERTIWARPEFVDVPDAIRVTSPAFADGGPIPARFTEDGDGLSPALAWSGVPDGAGSIVLVIEDADSPTPQPIVHAIVAGLPGRDGDLAEGVLPLQDDDGEAATTGRNSFGGAEYLPPDPPPGHGQHRYLVQVYALVGAPVFEGAPGRSALVEALRASPPLARGSLLGTYERP